MPRYFFHVRRGQLTVIDPEGIELTDVAEVAREAARRGREVATREALKGIPPQGGFILVDDEWEERVFELPFEDIGG
jgi:Domain of unknown function (DUF6894)